MEPLALAVAMRPGHKHYADALAQARATHAGPPGPRDERASRTTSAGAPWLRGSDQPLAQAYDVALLDLDGVVYRGGQPVEHAAEALAAARAQGMRLAFVTNNASRTPAHGRRAAGPARRAGRGRPTW